MQIILKCTECQAILEATGKVNSIYLNDIEFEVERCYCQDAQSFEDGRTEGYGEGLVDGGKEDN